jgi:hypothetical protein
MASGRRVPNPPLVMITTIVLMLATGPIAIGAEKSGASDPARIARIARMLSETPKGVGPICDDRQAWGKVAQAPAFAGAVGAAEKLVSQPIPELTDKLFLDFSRTGNRTRCQRVLGQRHGRIPALVLAECIEDRGRFLEPIEEAIRAVCSEKTWVMPAHDRGLANFEGRTVEVDLAVVAVSWNMATADYWLGDRLSREVRDLIHAELERRTLGPFESYVNTGKPRLWWATGTNNWNSVCLAGVTGTALVQIESRQRRAFFVASAEKYIEYFLKGFTADGYCSEGLGYWNYGFGNYVALGETIYQATGGKLDLLDRPKIREIAQFAPRMEIGDGVYPAFADCSVTARPGTQLMAFLSRRFGMMMKDEEERGLLLGSSSSNLFAVGLHGFANSATRTSRLNEPTALAAGPDVNTDSPDVNTDSPDASAFGSPGRPEEIAPPVRALRNWFSDAGILICRPAPQTSYGLGVALKGGHNSEHHNHNDVGSFVVALGGKTPLLDPGGEIYTARTFSKDRYASGVLNSLGHPVPRVAGKLQKTGRSAAARVLDTRFTDTTDTLVLDIRAAYGVKELESLKRTFVYSREGSGSLTVVDEVGFTSPQTFETALITFSKWEKVADDRLVIGQGNGAVEVAISTDGQPWRLQPEEIREDLSGGRVPVRLGIVLTEAVERTRVTVKITPVE